MNPKRQASLEGAKAALVRAYAVVRQASLPDTQVQALLTTLEREHLAALDDLATVTQTVADHRMRVASLFERAGV